MALFHVYAGVLRVLVSSWRHNRALQQQGTWQICKRRSSTLTLTLTLTMQLPPHIFQFEREELSVETGPPFNQ